MLIRGQKGTGKTLAVRGLGEILPVYDSVKDCRYNCDPNVRETLCPECKEKLAKGELVVEKRQMKVVDLPLNITEDRLVGTIDIEKVLSQGSKGFEPGILSGSHRNILYVDELNLLDDSIVDVLLDAAAMGVITVEREGISIGYQAKFVLIGSMNPEEGELRPQLLDRLALQAEVIGMKDIKERVEIVKRREEYTHNADTFRAKFVDSQKALAARIQKAREQLPRVTTPPNMLAIVAKICIDFNVDGHRADIIIDRTAKTYAAFEGRLEVTVEDIIMAAEMALPHRMRKQPFEEEEFSSVMLRKLVKKYDTGKS
jgi:magnesium chelatase subunit I